MREASGRKRWDLLGIKVQGDRRRNSPALFLYSDVRYRVSVSTSTATSVNLSLLLPLPAPSDSLYRILYKECAKSKDEGLPQTVMVPYFGMLLDSKNGCCHGNHDSHSRAKARASGT